METMRSSGVQTGGPPLLSQADRQNFANKLDTFLVKNFKKESFTCALLFIH